MKEFGIIRGHVLDKIQTIKRW